MTVTRKFFKVFLASPGDLAEERIAAKQVVDEYNRLLGDALGFHADLVGWEDTMPGLGRPQELINRDLEGCDLFVGMLWKRWGSPPDQDNRYTSGFEEEYRLSLDRAAREKKPEMHLLLKEVDASALIDPGEQLKRVLDFKAQVFAERKLLVKKFANAKEFEGLLRQCIQGFAIALKDYASRDESSKKNYADEDGPVQIPSADEAAAPGATLLPAKATQFLRNLLAEKRDAENPVSAYEVARFRLLANLTGVHGNDDSIINAHDANLIFRESAFHTLTAVEHLALVEAGLEHVKTENVPLWHWIRRLSVKKQSPLLLRSIIGASMAQKVGAITSMTLIGESIAGWEEVPRDQILDLWLSDEGPSELRVAGIEYLGSVGTEADINRLRTERDRNDSQTERAAIKSIFSILLRHAPEELFPAIIEFQPDTLAPDFLRAAITKVSPPTLQLLRALEHRSRDVRLVALKEIRRRKALANDVAEKLLEDEDANIRAEALLALATNGRSFTAAQTKAILVKKRPGTTYLSGILSGYGNDFDGEQVFEQYIDQIRSADTEESLLADRGDGLADYTAFFALSRKRPSEYRAALIDAAKDLFEKKYASGIQQMIDALPTNLDLVEKWKSLEEYIRKKLTRKALDLIVMPMDANDLEVVRQIFRSGFVDYDVEDLKYFELFGDASDIPFILRAKKARRGFGLGISLGYAYPASSSLATVINGLAKGDLAKALEVGVADEVIVELMQVLGVQSFLDLPERLKLDLLRSRNERVRKATALRAVTAFSKKNLLGILKTYMASAEFFYNVIYWLDFGISVRGSSVRKFAEKQLKAM